MVARHGRDASHEITGDEGADHHRAPAGRLLLEWVTVKVQGGQYDWHLADLPGIAWKKRKKTFLLLLLPNIKTHFTV